MVLFIACVGLQEQKDTSLFWNATVSHSPHSHTLSHVGTPPPARCSTLSFKSALKICSKDTEDCNKAVEAESWNQF